MSDEVHARHEYFLTGTDTGVGKTLVACALVHALARRGRRVAVMKPVAAGAELRGGTWRNDDVERLMAVSNVAADVDHVCPYLLPDAMAPHIAAQIAGVVVQWARIESAFCALRAQADALVVEGVGGFRVPLAPGWSTADLAQQMGLPVILVVGLRLGCLNHAALTAEAIAARGLRLQAWVANQIDPHMVQVERNLQTLEQMIAAPCLGRIQWREQPAVREVAEELDLSSLGHF